MLLMVWIFFKMLNFAFGLCCESFVVGFSNLCAHCVSCLMPCCHLYFSDSPFDLLVLSLHWMLIHGWLERDAGHLKFRWFGTSSKFSAFTSLNSKANNPLTSCPSNSSTLTFLILGQQSRFFTYEISWSHAFVRLGRTSSTALITPCVVVKNFSTSSNTPC